MPRQVVAFAEREDVAAGHILLRVAVYCLLIRLREPLRMITVYCQVTIHKKQRKDYVLKYTRQHSLSPLRPHWSIKASTSLRQPLGSQ